MTLWKKLSSAKTVSEIFQILTWQDIEKLAAMPLFLMTSALILCMVHYQIFGYGLSNITFFRDFMGYSTAIAVPVILLCVGKIISEKKTVQQLVHENMSIVLFFVLALLMIVSTTVNGLTDYAVYGFQANESAFNYLQYIFIFYLLGSVIQNTEIKKWYLRIFLMIGSFLAALEIVDYYFFPVPQFRATTFEKAAHAIFSNSNHYGYYLVMVIMLSSMAYVADENKKWKWFYLFNFLINSVVLVLNNTFGAFLACIAALLFQMIVLWILQHRISKETLIFLVLFLAVFFIMSTWYYTVFSNFTIFIRDILNIAKNKEEASTAGSGRWRLWVKTVELIQEKPLLGWGAEGITDILYKTYNEYRTHNEFLQYAVFFGIPAGICYIAANFTVFLHGLKYKIQLDLWTTAMLVASFGYLASSFVGNSKVYVTPFFFIMLGLGFGIKKK